MQHHPPSTQVIPINPTSSFPELYAQIVLISTKEDSSSPGNYRKISGLFTPKQASQPSNVFAYVYACTCVYVSVRCMNLTLRSAIIVVVMAIFDLLNLTLWLI